MKDQNLSLTAAALVLLSGTALMAQSSTAPQPTDRNKDGTVVVRDDRMENRSAALIPSAWVIGETVVDNGREKVGRIEDLILDASDGHVVYALLDRDATDTMPGTTVAVPWMAFSWDSANRTVVLPMDRSLLVGATEFDAKRWELLQDETWVDRTYAYFKVDEAAYSDLWETDAIDDKDRTNPDADKRAKDPAVKDRDVKDRDMRDPATKDRDALKDPKHRDMDGRDDSLGTPADGAQYVLASKVKGQTLRGAEDKQIGDVEELVFDAISGRMAFIVAQFGGFLGVGDSKVAVPWDYFEVNDEGHLYTNNIKADEVRNAPRIERDDWADLRDTQFGPRVYKHYGRDPSWFETAPRKRVLGTDRGLDLDDRDGVMDDDYRSLYGAGTDSEVSGTVTRMSVEEPAVGTGQLKTVIVKTDSGDRVIHLAPDAYLTEKGWKYKEGDRITVKGRTATVNGKEVLIASSYRGADGTYVELRDAEGSPMWSGDR